MSQNSRNQGFSYYICLMIEGSGSGSIPPDPGGQKHVDPVDPDSDPEHWLWEGATVLKGHVKRLENLNCRPNQLNNHSEISSVADTDSLNPNRVFTNCLKTKFIS